MAKTTPNFRLSGIPAEYQSKKDIHLLVQRILAIDVSLSELHIQSLAASPYRPEYNVATFYFENTPPKLLDETKTWWRFPDGDDVDSEALTLDTHFHGFTPLQQAINGDFSIDVVAISGLNGHAFGSFKDRGGSFMWLRDALPKDLPSARILIYGYDTKLLESESTQNMIDIGRKLERQLRLIRKLKEDRPIIFIGHSLGGLVIKQAIIEHWEEGHSDTSMLNFISAFLFFGVPHLGMHIKPLRPMVKENPNRSFLESLDETSAYLRCLNGPFKNALHARSPEVIAFYETERSRTPEQVNNTWRLSGPHEVSVEEHSATWHSTKQHPITRDHSESVKFQNNHDPDYLYVLDILRRLTSDKDTRVGASRVVLKLSPGQAACLQSLAFREQESAYQKVRDAHKTCQWLFDEPNYKQWMSGQRGLFWITGVPGAGKSVLMKFATRMMQSSQPRHLVVHFFCQATGVSLQKSPVGVFRALLNSMLQFFPEFLDQLTTTFQDRQNRFGPNKWEWAEDDLQQVISDVLTRGTKSQPVVVFVDALDECGEAIARQIITFFGGVTDKAKIEGSRIRICFSSRSYPNLGFSEIPAISVENYNQEDIRSVVQRSLAELTPVHVRQEVEKKILSKAQGVFQWAVLVTDEVAQKDRSGVRDDELFKIMDRLPEGLDELYTTILNNVDPAEISQVFKLFRWVLCAMRPLRAKALRAALATDVDMKCTTLSELQRHPSWIDDFAKFEKHVRTLSRGLVQLQTRKSWREAEPDYDDESREDVPNYEDGSSDDESSYDDDSSDDDWNRTAQFIHQSVADHLQRKATVLSKHCTHASRTQITQSGIAHFEISRSCLRYMKLKETVEAAEAAEAKGHTMDGHLALPALAWYAVQSFLYHIQQVERRGICQCDLHLLLQGGFVQILARLGSVVSENPHSYFKEPRPPLHALIALGSKTAVSTFLRSHGAGLGDRDTNGNTPLQLSIIKEHQDITLFLLSNNTLATAQNNPLTSPLQAAEAGELAEAIEFPLDKNGFINAVNEKGETALFLAVTKGSLEIVEKLLERGADVECANWNGQTPLIWAALTGQEIMVQLLLDIGLANVNGRDKFGRVPLTWAAAFLHEPVVALLLKVNGINLENKDQGGETPLLSVMKFGGQMRDLVCGVGADFNINTRQMDDIKRKLEPEVGLLDREKGGWWLAILDLWKKYSLLQKISSDAREGRGYMEGFQNLFEEQFQVIKLLVDNGANVEAIDADGRTALWWAAKHGDKRLIELLQSVPNCGRDHGSHPLPDVTAGSQDTSKRSAGGPAQGDGERVRGRRM